MSTDPVPQPPLSQPVPQAPPPSNKKRTWTIVAIVAGVLALLCCIGVIGAGIWGFNLVKDATGPLTDTAVSYLEDIEKGNYGSAYDRLCDDSKDQLSLSDFSAAQSLLPKITGHQVTGSNINSTNGTTTGTVNVRLTRERFGDVDQLIHLIKEGGDWKICQPAI